MNTLARFVRVAVVCLALSSVVAMGRAARAQDKAKKIDELMTLCASNGQFNGTVLVAEKGRVIFKKGFGLANMEWDVQNQPDTKFRLGSITKQFTSMLIMQLVQEGKVKLDGKLTDYLPDYRKDTGDRVTVHNLLTHTSGIPSYTELPRFFEDVSRNPYSVDEFVKKYCSGDLEFEPGSKFSYDNSGYFLLGAIIEKVTGKPYERVLRERILDPAGMKDTGYDHHEDILKKRATGYGKRPGRLINSLYLDMSIPYAAGSLYSTVEDLYLWDQILYADKLLAPKYKEMIFKPFLQNYAYGWFVQKMPLGNSKDMAAAVSHGGGINGFNTLIVRFVDDRNLIVLLNNTGGAALQEMGNAIAGILYDKPYAPPKKSLAEALMTTIVEKDLAAAIQKYHDLKAHESTGYNFGEGQLNQLGYQLLGMKRVKDAIEILKLNVEAYPASFNPYDSLAEAYTADGQTDLAVKNYKKSLELNPQNANAVEKLKKLNAN
jgi:CubicO group peptidase (beta-lactamase class C family)